MTGVMRMKKTMTNGKTNPALNDLFVQQMVNQDRFIQEGIYDHYKMDETTQVPVDDVGLFSYHMQHLMSEVGEVLDSDKRWKTHRNGKFDKDAKLDEIADCFIVLMNVAMFSGFNGYQLTDAIKKKLDIVSDRV